jgi:hypothetical protein
VEIATLQWQISGDQEAIERCKRDEKFRYVVAIARSANTLISVHSLMLRGGEEITPRAMRDRLNSYFLASALLYEALKLIRCMNSVFRNDEPFQKGLRLILKDRTAQKIEKDHLNSIRHNATFHFDPDIFAKAIGANSRKDFIFARGQGLAKIDVDYTFADVIAAEILVGLPEDNDHFDATLAQAMDDTKKLLATFMYGAEIFISYHLKRWGLEKQWIQELPVD